MKTEPRIQGTEGRNRNAEGKTRPCKLRFTFHVSRFTLPVRRHDSAASRAPQAARAFTLIELLIVISVIALLAALTFPAVTGARISMLRARARSERTQIETAIERYHDKLGYYPPDNPANWAMNQLYYELLGTTNIGTATVPIYMTLDGSAQVKGADLSTAFGTTGFMNYSRVGRGDEAPSAISFLTGLKPGQSLLLTNIAGVKLCTILVCALDGPPAITGFIGGKINPWRYNSSNPVYNKKSFDLWIDVMAGSKTNRICNWSDKPLVVSHPYP